MEIQVQATYLIFLWIISGYDPRKNDAKGKVRTTSNQTTESSTSTKQTTPLISTKSSNEHLLILSRLKHLTHTSRNANLEKPTTKRERKSKGKAASTFWG